MKLYASARPPNPRRVLMFLAEKRIADIEIVDVDLATMAHRHPDFLARNPFARIPVLELDDGRYLSESRAICRYLEALHPEPNLMGRDPFEAAFIEEADRRAEFSLLLTIANAVRHAHPGLAALEQPQFPDFGRSQLSKLRGCCEWFEQTLARQPFLAGERYSIADITAYCALEFARGLLKFRLDEQGMVHMQRWRDAIAARSSGS